MDVKTALEKRCNHINQEIENIEHHIQLLNQNLSQLQNQLHQLKGNKEALDFIMPILKNLSSM
jgi:prefoldin subunit 5